MVNVIYASIWLLALWFWGDWKHWKKYYPTILFFMIGDLVYLYMFSDYFPLWKYSIPEIDQKVNLTNTHISLSIMLIKYPATILIYLAKFPKQNKTKQFFYMGLWVFIYFVNEVIDVKFHLITYSNGWNLWWSLIFNCVMFYILRIHFIQPLIAWLLSIIFIVFLWQVFDVPSVVFR